MTLEDGWTLDKWKALRCGRADVLGPEVRPWLVLLLQVGKRAL